jgi:hypothetical protein
MPAYSFKGQFVPYVEEGSKPHTIRNRRKYPVKIGDTLYLYFGLRTKYVRKLREEICTDVRSISISERFGIVLYTRLLDRHELDLARKNSVHQSLPILFYNTSPGNISTDRFAWRDGFRPEGTTIHKPDGSFDLMLRFWKQTHELPWAGDIIYWEPKKIKS